MLSAGRRLRRDGVPAAGSWLAGERRQTAPALRRLPFTGGAFDARTGQSRGQLDHSRLEARGSHQLSRRRPVHVCQRLWSRSQALGRRRDLERVARPDQPSLAGEADRVVARRAHHADGRQRDQRQRRRWLVSPPSWIAWRPPPGAR
jgi:hypothetical protein